MCTCTVYFLEFVFCLSGLHWHLSGLPEIRVEQPLLLSLASELLFSVFHSFLEYEPCFYYIFVLFCEHVFIENLPHAQHSTTQPARHKTANQARTVHRATTQKSGQSWPEPASRRAFVHLCSPNERRHRNVPDLQKLVSMELLHFQVTSFHLKY